MRLTGLFALAAAAALAGCNAARPPEPAAVAPGASARTAAAPNLQLPEGAACSGAISRYRAVIENDLSMGHVNQGVYNQIQGEISDAAAACSAGQDAKAVSLVRASKSRHGYPGG